MRREYVLSQGLIPGGRVGTAAHAFDVLTIRLLKHAFCGDEREIEDDLHRARESAAYGGIFETLGLMSGSLDAWLRYGPLPPTPYMSRTELARAALQGGIKGFRNTGMITKKIQARVLHVTSECEQSTDGHTRYAKFEVVDRQIQLKLLRGSVEFLKHKLEKRSFFLGPIWTAESTDLRSMLL